MRSIITRTVSALSLVTVLAGAGACSKDPTCENVVDHTLEIMPSELKSALGEKKDLVAQCEKKTTESERKCALEADSMEDLAKCRGK